jgi:uncharacterized Zn ribbon protein
MEYILKCKRCNKEFTSQTPHLFCSTKCADDWLEDKIFDVSEEARKRKAERREEYE